MLKLYEPEWYPDERVWEYLRSGRKSRAVVETVETERVDGRYYELMERLPGDDLMTLRGKSTLEELGTDQVTAIVVQLLEALDEIHANGLVHRDLKPANIVVRKLAPIEIAVVDFGISSPSGEEVTDRNGTAPYTSPQFLAAGSVEPADDFWALGISLIEIFTGSRILGGLGLDGEEDQVALKARIVSAPINTSAVTDERLRLLCSGLTAQAARPRWGSKQVRAWLAGDSPPVAGYRVSSEEERPGGAEEPYRYGEVDHRFPDELAAAMTVTWENAALTLFGSDSSEAKTLRRWLRQFRAIRWPEGRLGSRDPDDVRLLRVLRAMEPTAPPVYRGYNIARGRLPELARKAFEGDGNASAVVGELATYGLLSLLATGRQTPELESGDGLSTVAANWESERGRLTRGLAALPDDARADMARLERDNPVQLRAMALLAVTANEEIRRKANREVQRAVRRARRFESDLGWFADLADRQGALWLAYLLVPFVTARIDRIAEEAAAARRRREWLRRSQAIREWSRRQNRPQALAWSVAGVATVAVVCALTIGLSDAAGFSSEGAIVAAWLITVFGLAVVLAGEALLAWEVGGGFHPRYSLLGAGRVELGRGARGALATRSALLVVLGLLGGTAVISVFLPVLLPVTVAGLVPFWAWRRFLSWEDDRVREQAEIERAERERQEQATRTREEGVG